MSEEKKCLCGSPKRREQNWCDDCDQNLSKCETSEQRTAYFLEKVKKNQEAEQ